MGPAAAAASSLSEDGFLFIARLTTPVISSNVFVQHCLPNMTLFRIYSFFARSCKRPPSCFCHHSGFSSNFLFARARMLLRSLPPFCLIPFLPRSLWASTKLFLMRAQTHGRRKRRRKSTMERGDCKNPVFPLFLVSPPVTAATIALKGGVKNSPFAIENGGPPIPSHFCHLT